MSACGDPKRVAPVVQMPRRQTVSNGEGRKRGNADKCRPRKGEEVFMFVFVEITKHQEIPSHWKDSGRFVAFPAEGTRAEKARAIRKAFRQALNDLLGNRITAMLRNIKR
jgi:hypothetical protein